MGCIDLFSSDYSALLVDFSSSSFLSMNRSTRFSWIQGVVLSASPIRRGTANLAKFTNAKASAPSFCKSSESERSGQWLQWQTNKCQKWASTNQMAQGKRMHVPCDFAVSENTDRDGKGPKGKLPQSIRDHPSGSRFFDFLHEFFRLCQFFLLFVLDFDIGFPISFRSYDFGLVNCCKSRLFLVCSQQRSQGCGILVLDQWRSSATKRRIWREWVDSGQWKEECTDIGLHCCLTGRGVSIRVWICWKAEMGSTLLYLSYFAKRNCWFGGWCVWKR